MDFRVFGKKKSGEKEENFRIWEMETGRERKCIGKVGLFG